MWRKEQVMKEYDAIYFYWDDAGDKVAVGGIECGKLSEVIQPSTELYERLISSPDVVEPLYVDIAGIGSYRLAE